MNRSTDDRLMPDQMREATQVALEQLRQQYGELAPLYEVPAPPRCDPKLRDVPIGRRIAASRRSFSAYEIIPNIL
jgi:hypothetical protein